MTKTGLTSYQLKIIALCTMTLDHLAAYGGEISICPFNSLPVSSAGYHAAVGKTAVDLTHI